MRNIVRNVKIIMKMKDKRSINEVGNWVRWFVRVKHKNGEIQKRILGMCGFWRIGSNF